MASTLTDAIHLVSSDSASGLVKQLGAPKDHVRILSERLTIGPCDVDPARHVELRRAWNADEAFGTDTFGLDDLRVAVADDLPVIVWATRAYADLVWLWWIMDGLGRLRRLLFVARPLLADPLATAGGATPEEGRAALADLRTVRDDELMEGCDFWRMYASPEPLAFDESRRRGSLVFPELSESAELHGTWFPRLEGGRLRLAENDELLLSRLTDQWLTVRELFFKTRGYERLLWPFGGSIPVRRLREWAAHGAVAREVRACDSHLEQDAFCLTDKTRTLLANGLEGVGEAPPLYVGGCRLYDPAAPWVRVANGSGWRIIRLTART